MIGGIDIIIAAPPGSPVTDLILKRLLYLWPEARFLDAEEEDSHFIEEPWVQIFGFKSTEFFVFRDKDMEEAWKREGAVPELSNTMLHFLIDRPDNIKDEPVWVTLVCDEETPEVTTLVKDLEMSFRSSWFPNRAQVA